MQQLRVPAEECDPARPAVIHFSPPVCYTGVVEKLVFVAEVKKSLLAELSLDGLEVKVYRSKGLLAHLLNRKHYIAAKYLDFIPDIIGEPDYAGTTGGQIELVKCFRNSIFLSIKLDKSKGTYYVATMFDVKQSKIESYCRTGRLKKLRKD